MWTQTTQELKPENTITNILTGEIMNPEQYVNYMICENTCAPKVEKFQNSYCCVTRINQLLSNWYNL